MFTDREKPKRRTKVKQPKEYDGYSLEDVAEEMAQTYGGEVSNYYVEEDKLVVEINEYGEISYAELPLNSIKEFMEM